MDVCFNTSDVTLTVFIGIYFYLYFHLTCSTKKFVYCIIVNILYSFWSNIMTDIVKQSDLSPDNERSDDGC